MLQYGIDGKKCAEIGIDGLIIPISCWYAEKIQTTEKILINVFLITPQTSDERYIYRQRNGDLFIW
jgi:tryptophan synthase alpha subunit